MVLTFFHTFVLHFKFDIHLLPADGYLAQGGSYQLPSCFYRFTVTT